MMTGALWTVLGTNLYQICSQATRELAGTRLPVFTASAAILAGLLAGFYYLSLASDFMNGRRSLPDWFELLKPLIIFFCVCRFSALVVTPLNAVVGVFAKPIAVQAEAGVKKSLRTQVSEVTAMANTASRNAGEQMGTGLEELRNSFRDDDPSRGRFRRVLDSVMTIYKGSLKYYNAGVQAFSVRFLSTAIEKAVRWIETFVLMGLQIISAVLSTLLVLVGPLTFAISVMPWFSGGIKLWFERYVEFQLWAPVSNLIYTVTCYISDCGETLITNMSSGEGSFGAIWMNILLMTVSIVCLTKTRAISSWIIETAGDSGVTDAAKAGGRKVVTLLTRIK